MASTEVRHWDELRALLADGAAEPIEAYLETLDSSDVVRTLFRLSADEQRELLTTISPDSAAELIEELPDAHAAELIDELPAHEAASIVEELSSDEQADLLAEMDEEDAEAILEQMDEEDARDARRLIAFPSDTAGGLMMTEFVSYPRAYTVRQVIDDLSTRADEYALFNVQYVYVVVRRYKLLGVLRLRDMVFLNPETRIGAIAMPAASVAASTTLDELEDFFDEHELAAVPVVDERSHILGVVRRRAVLEALTEREETQRLRMAGIVGGEELRTLPLLLRARRRLSWLSVNIVLNIIAASVIALYQDTLAAVIALAVFLPIVSDMSGCSGNQAVAVSLRELTLGVIVPRDFARVWLKEAAVGVCNGIVLGLLLAGAAWAWQGNPWLGAVVGAALAINTLVAVSIGGTVPLVLRGLGIDPALASGPVLTTITDMCGFFLVLSFATVMLPMLT